MKTLLNSSTSSINSTSDSPLTGVSLPARKRPIVITVFNHKGGVGKSTAVHNIGYILAELMGLRVLMVDGDSQCNLTGLIWNSRFMGDGSGARKFYEQADAKAALGRNHPDFELLTIGHCFQQMVNPNNMGVPDIQTADKVKIQSATEETDTWPYHNLFFLPGHIDTAQLDTPLSMGIGGIGFYRPAVPLISNFLRRVGWNHNMDIVLIDISPSLGGFNQSIIMGSDYYMVPFFPDFSSYQAVQSLSKEVHRWLLPTGDFQIFRRPASSPDAWDEFKGTPRLLGAFPQRTRYRHVKGVEKIEESFAIWIEQIYQCVKTLIPDTRHDESGAELKEPMSITYSSLSLEHNRNKVLVAPHFQLRQIEGVPDFAGVGMDVQKSGHPIADVNYPHRHFKQEQNKFVLLTKINKQKKKKAHQVYLKVLGLLFGNMDLEDLARLGPAFELKLNMFSAAHPSSASDTKQGDHAESNPTTPVSRKRKFNTSDTSWYDDDKINFLLRYFLSDSNWEILDCISGTDSNGTILTTNLEQALRQNKRRAEQQQQPLHIIVPVNLNQRHWVMLYIRQDTPIKQEHSSPSEDIHPDTHVYYYDPLGEPIPPELNEILVGIPQADPNPSSPSSSASVGVFPGATLVPLTPPVQRDTYNCGAWLVEAAIAICTRNRIPDETLNITQQRQLHQEAYQQCVNTQQHTDDPDETEDENKNEDLWYTDRRMNWLLQHLIQQNPRIGILRAMSGHQVSGKNLDTQLKQYLATQQPHANPILRPRPTTPLMVPLNLGSHHWVLMHLHWTDEHRPDHMAGEHHPDHIDYLDPLGHPIPIDLRGMFSGTQFVQITPRVEYDESHSGTWVVEAAVAIANSKVDHGHRIITTLDFDFEIQQLEQQQKVHQLDWEGEPINKSKKNKATAESLSWKKRKKETQVDADDDAEEHQTPIKVNKASKKQENKNKKDSEKKTKKL